MVLDRGVLGSTGINLSCIGFSAFPWVTSTASSPPTKPSMPFAVLSPLASTFLYLPFRPPSLYLQAFPFVTLSLPLYLSLFLISYQIIFSTKCGCYSDGFDFSVDRVSRSINESLIRLRLDSVDILHCHGIELGSLDLIVNETIPSIQKIKAEGKTRFIGI